MRFKDDESVGKRDRIEGGDDGSRQREGDGQNLFLPQNKDEG